MTHLCPRCHAALRPERRAEGQFYVCDSCRGAAALLPAPPEPTSPPPEPASAPPEHGPGGGRFVLEQEPRELRSCPACAETMRSTRMKAFRGWRTVDVCPRCRMAWFDAGELEALSVRPDPSALPDSMRAREAAAMLDLAKHQDSPAAPVEVGSPEWLAGAAGVPVLIGLRDEDRRPWATWIVCGAIVLLAILQQFGDPGQREGRSSRLIWDEVVGLTTLPWSQVMGFLPSDPFRHGGLTFLTGLLLHGGLYHALYNAYFLLLVGSVLELALGWGRMLLVLLLSSFAGDLADVFVRWGSTVPSVGASGGIAGLFGLCAFAVPKLRLGFTLGVWWTPTQPRFGQLRLGVRWVFGLWLLGEIIAMTGILDRDVQLGLRPARVAYHAHVVGALTGVGLVWLSRRRSQGSPAPATPRRATTPR